MNTIYRILSTLQHPFLLVLRLYWGYSFLQAGLGKFGDINRVAGFFTELGILYPQYTAYLVATTETVGGALLLAGLFARLASIPLVITMITALLTAHAEATFNLWQDPDTFLKEEPILFLNAALIVTLFGPGFFSLDALRCRLKSRKSASPPV